GIAMPVSNLTAVTRVTESPSRGRPHRDPVIANPPARPTVGPAAVRNSAPPDEVRAVNPSISSGTPGNLAGVPFRTHRHSPGDTPPPPPTWRPDRSRSPVIRLLTRLMTIARPLRRENP